MKKLLLTAMIICGCWTSQAQIANGSDAPDFTVTDLNGNVHVLSDYLAQGKTVIIDISATWCSPCWNYHQSGALDNLNYAYGQGGTEEVVVLFVEGDSSTPLDCLYGISDQNLTWGNWVEHSSFPIINSAELASLYQITYFPTIFRICPNGKVNVIGQFDFYELEENITENCEPLVGSPHNGKITIMDQKVCEGNIINPQVSIKNYGTQTITSAVIELREDDTVLATKNYTGSVELLDEEIILFDPLVIAPGTNYQTVITSINGDTPTNSQTAKYHFNVIEAVEGYNNITVNVHINYYPEEISWAIKNSSGSYVASGGPYLEGDANTTKTHNVTLPETTMECYSVEFYSSSGYGWIMGDTPHGIDIESGGETIFSQRVDNFGYVLKVPSAFKTNGTLGIEELNTNQFTIFPNPTTGIIHFTTKEQISLTIIDMTGKIVYKAEGINDGQSINLSSLQKGMYIMRNETTSARRTEKIIIN